MTSGYVSYEEVGGDALARQLEAHKDALQYLLLERVDALRFERFDAPPAGIADWPRGRAFGAEVEVRWRQLAPDRFELLVLTETEPRGPGWARYDSRAADSSGSALRHFLWGTYRPGLEGWAEAQLPHPQRYPLAPEHPFAVVEVVEYSRDGIVQLTRFRALRGEAGHG